MSIKEREQLSRRRRKNVIAACVATHGIFSDALIAALLLILLNYNKILIDQKIDNLLHHNVFKKKLNNFSQLSHITQCFITKKIWCLE